MWMEGVRKGPRREGAMRGQIGDPGDRGTAQKMPRAAERACLLACKVARRQARKLGIRQAIHCQATVGFTSILQPKALMTF
jgi:hypothetical protein